jgi:replicative DNA helicase
MRLRNPHAELQAVITILDGPTTVSAKLLGMVREEHFGYGPTHEIITAVYRHISRRKADEPAELPSARSFRFTPGLSDIARDLLGQKHKPVRHEADIPALYDTLEYFRKVRVLHGFVRNVAKQMSGAAGTVDLTQVREDMVQTSERMILRDESTVFTHIPGKGAAEAFKEALEHTQLISSPFKNFNDMAGGFALGDLHILASHRSGGKSAMLNCLADYFYSELNLSTAIVQLEMSRATQVRRLLAKKIKFKHSTLRQTPWHKLDKETRRNLQEAYRAHYKHGVKHGCAFDIITPGNISAMGLELLLRPFNYRVILIDYLNLMELDGQPHDNEASRLGATAKALKHMARRLNAAVFALTQLDMAEDKIRYSRAIEEHADLVWAWRWGKEEQEGGRVTAINQMKTRHFEPFVFYLKPVLDYMTFEPATEDEVMSMTTPQDKKFTKSMEGNI